MQVTQESREAEDIQATVAEEEQTVGIQTAETAALKGKPNLGCTHYGSTRWLMNEQTTLSAYITEYHV